MHGHTSNRKGCDRQFYDLTTCGPQSLGMQTPSRLPESAEQVGTIFSLFV